MCTCGYGQEGGREGGVEKGEREREMEGEKERESCIQDSGMLGVVYKSSGSNKISQLL